MKLPDAVITSWRTCRYQIVKYKFPESLIGCAIATLMESSWVTLSRPDMGAICTFSHRRRV